uniref:uncharacterized protein LOC122609475 n=1 Tax=Erigeron canadensis TaxID=72917 RepID=UPI001CB9A016|nr:uncharacterized protein LOC122609475 [Erigeron canadensis]
MEPTNGRDDENFNNAKNSYNHGIIDKRAGTSCTSSSSPNDAIEKKINKLIIGDQQVEDCVFYQSKKVEKRIGCDDHKFTNSKDGSNTNGASTSSSSANDVMEKQSLMIGAQRLEDLKFMKSHKDAERINMIQEYIDKSSLQMLYPSLNQQSLRVQVIYFVKQLVEGSLGCHACVYGSTSLKTFLPDGDIDFTILSPFEDTDITSKVKFLLEMEAKRPNSRIAQVQLIDAKVKIVKCNVNGIDIDLSSNQLMGMGATTFYEYANERFKKDHLFKRSVILLKAWCSYRKRPILGSSKGLLSTSALNVMIFYVINAFYDELTGPFSVLNRFISYYGEFMWKNNTLSVKGPKIGAKVDGLISDHEIDLIVWDLTRGRKTMGHFPQKSNIEDPLCPTNNLGTSVSEGM